jgi:hypothetical protein
VSWLHERNLERQDVFGRSRKRQVDQGRVTNCCIYVQWTLKTLSSCYNDVFTWPEAITRDISSCRVKVRLIPDEGQVSTLLQHAFFGDCPGPDTTGSRRQVHDADAQTQLLPVDNTCTHINQPLLFHELQSALNRTTQSSPGSDGIDYNIIKHLPLACLRVLLHLFNTVWSVGLIPHQWSTQ